MFDSVEEAANIGSFLVLEDPLSSFLFIFIERSHVEVPVSKLNPITSLFALLEVSCVALLALVDNRPDAVPLAVFEVPGVGDVRVDC